jgi:excisionase family DNA binding protein
MDFTGKRLLSVNEAALYLGLSPRTLYNGVHRKTKSPFPIQPKRFRKRVLFDIQDLDRWVDSLNALHSESSDKVITK